MHFRSIFFNLDVTMMVLDKILLRTIPPGEFPLGQLPHKEIFPPGSSLQGGVFQGGVFLEPSCTITAAFAWTSNFFYNVINVNQCNLKVIVMYFYMKYTTFKHMRSLQVKT